MVVRFSRRRMLATALLPVLPFVEPAPVPAAPIWFHPVAIGRFMYTVHLHREAPTDLGENEVALEGDDGAGYVVIRRVGLTPAAQRLQDAQEEMLARWKRGEGLPDPLPEWVITGKMD